MLPPRMPFELPTTVTIAFHRDRGDQITAHALDFDLACTGKNYLEACKKVRLAIRSYIEFGFLNGWAEDIRYPAPEKFWPPQGTELEVMEPITIMDRQLLVYSASSIANECREAATVA